MEWEKGNMEEIITEDFPELMKHIKQQIKEVQQIPKLG